MTKLISLYPTLFMLLCFSCNNLSNEENKDSFIFIGRNEYTQSSFNGLIYYKLKSSKELMNGYYVVGNKTTKWEEFEVKDGLLNGDYIIFHNNGNIYSHSHYIQGLKEGEELTYSLDGKLQNKNNYNNDAKNGLQYSYFDNGNLSTTSKFDNGNFIESVNYNILGQITSQSFIKNDQRVKQVIKYGKVYSETISNNNDTSELLKLYNEDGSLKFQMKTLEDDDNMFLIELDENGNELKRINLKEQPYEAMKYMAYFQ